MHKSSSISIKLLLGVLTISSIATAVFTLINLANDFNSEMDAVSDALEGLRRSSAGVLSLALYNYDDESVTSQANGILSLPFVTSLTVVETGKKEAFAQQTKELSPAKEIEDLSIVRHFPSLANHTEEVSIPLYLDEDNNRTKIGALNLTITKRLIYDRLFTKTVYFGVFQAFKTFITSFILLMFFNMLVSSRLSKLNRKLNEINISKLTTDDLDLGIKLSKKRDELDQVIMRNQDMMGTILNFKQALEKDVDQHKTKALNSSRMATIGEMSAGIAHEINNPLAIISGCSEIIHSQVDQNGLINKDIVQKNQDSIRRAVSRIKGITYGLLKYSAKGDQLRLISVNMEDVIAEIYELCHLRAKSEDIFLRVNILESKIPKVKGDDVLIGQVIINLINNAIDAFKTVDIESKEIEIKLSDGPDDYVIVTVMNNGPKIPDNIRDKIMEPFFTTKEIGKGSGLGLSISQGIIQSLDGHMRLETEDRTSFVIELPKAAQ